MAVSEEGAERAREWSSAGVDLSVLVPVLDEERHLPATMAGMREQRFAGSLEFLFIDGGSTDGTRDLVAELARDDPRIRLLGNPRRRTPYALNIGLRAARGEFVARMDAHARYPPDYLQSGVDRLRRGDVAWVSGPQLPLGTGPWSRRIEWVLSSWLGTGAAAFRRAVRDAGGEAEVDTGWLGIWRRETLDTLGGWDEGWPINQDSELAARVREAGGRILCLAAMEARYLPRDSLRTLARQYWRYGQYRCKTITRHPQSMRRSHILPPALALTALTALGGRSPLARAARRCLLAYGLVVLGVSTRLVREHGSEALPVPLVFATMHVAWGLGFGVGCLRFGLPLPSALARRRRTPLAARLSGAAS